MQISQPVKVAVLSVVVAALVLFVATMMVRQGAIIARDLNAQGSTAYVDQSFVWLGKLLAFAGALSGFLGMAAGAWAGLTQRTGGLRLAGAGVGGLVTCSALMISTPESGLAIAAVAGVAVLGGSAVLGTAWAAGRGARGDPWVRAPALDFQQTTVGCQDGHKDQS